MISEEEMSRRIDLFTAYHSRNHVGKFCDMVTDMIDHAIACCADRYQDAIDEFEESQHKYKAGLQR